MKILQGILNALSVACFALVAIVVGTVVGALASPQDTTVNLGSFFEILTPYLVELAAMVIAAIVGWILMKLNKYTGLSIDARHRDSLQTALTNAASYALYSVEERLGKVSVDVKAALIADALKYVRASAPDAIDHFNLTPQRLRQLIEAKLILPAPPKSSE